MTLEFKVSTFIPATPENIYAAWLDSQKHAEMTGGTANVNAIVGEDFQAWDGYIEGGNLELIPNEKIVQSWRTVDFTESEEDSHLEITLLQVENGTKITIIHSNLPPHGGQYQSGWDESYFQPMKNYFEDRK